MLDDRDGTTMPPVAPARLVRIDLRSSRLDEPPDDTMLEQLKLLGGDILREPMSQTLLNILHRRDH